MTLPSDADSTLVIRLCQRAANIGLRPTAALGLCRSFRSPTLAAHVLLDTPFRFDHDNRWAFRYPVSRDFTEGA